MKKKNTAKTMPETIEKGKESQCCMTALKKAMHHTANTSQTS